MPKYSDCYPGCGGEDCPCCEIHLDHQREAQYNEENCIHGFYTEPTPCDYGRCPWDAQSPEACRVHCGLGVDECGADIPELELPDIDDEPFEVNYSHIDESELSIPCNHIA